MARSAGRTTRSQTHSTALPTNSAAASQSCSGITSISRASFATSTPTEATPVPSRRASVAAVRRRDAVGRFPLAAALPDDCLAVALSAGLAAAFPSALDAREDATGLREEDFFASGERSVEDVSVALAPRPASAFCSAAAASSRARRRRFSRRFSRASDSPSRQFEIRSFRPI